MTDGIKIHRRHGFYVLVMVVGWVLPPVAVLLRFGFGTDFFLNILLTLCGYIPGHGHNFYLQNIRNNENRKRTPQWATKAGLVKDPTAKRKAKTQWANRYDERTPTRADGYQDDDERPTASSREGGVPRSGLLEPESFMDSSSSITRDERSLENGHQPQRHPGHFSSQEARDLDRFPTDDRRHLRKKKSIGHRHTLSNLDNPSSTSSNGYEPSGIRDPNLNSSKIVRRQTSQSIRNHHHHHRDDHRHNHHQHNEEDPYFIRRASSIHGHPSSSSASHSKFGPLGSPTSTKSFSQKLGFGSTKKTEKKNRFDLTNEARSQWENLPHTTRHSTPHPKPLNHNDLNNDDCLNHQF
ncbi:hypothetical protein PGT21_017774 [Puccinia graminis f. sp. tritici]|uniref:Plasma membrane proteolipid Pmp3 n=1 Tax=Puccinia graminis f. sp. tritici TaxID=56615 RepID=A0A5B0RLY5_PUCGR|nr:hypothetical protein PGT21_017774 [Puccinia graminis f. sp. tritici]KAA1126926.1 hypothetical protein PGTUg99_031919 [Puccinia graminis f. sp. tritici]